MNKNKIIISLIILITATMSLSSCTNIDVNADKKAEKTHIITENNTPIINNSYYKKEKDTNNTKKKKTSIHIKKKEKIKNPYASKTVKVLKSFKYSNESEVKTGTATIYYTNVKNKKNITVAVNAGHGSSLSMRKYTYCNPWHGAKIVSGSTQSGSLKSVATSGGTTMLTGDSEAKATLKVAKKLKNILLNNGYDVLMIRETNDVNLDNIARTILANNYANCHIALHFDYSSTDKGAFAITTPNLKRYASNEPVKNTIKKSNRLCTCLIDGLRDSKVKIYNKGFLAIDLTQTSYSTVPTTDLELGDRKTDYSDKSIEKFCNGILLGLNKFFNQKN